MVVVEALTQAFGLPMLSPAPLTIEALHQHLNDLEDKMATLSDQLAELRQKTPLEGHNLRLIAALEQAVASFPTLSSTTRQLQEGTPFLEIEESLTLALRSDSQELESSFSEEQPAEERLQIINQLKQQLRTLDQFLSATPYLVGVLDSKGRCIYINPLGARTLGFERGYILGKTSQELDFPPELVGPFTTQYQGVFTTGRIASGEISIPTHNGVRDYEYILSPVQGSNGSIDSVVCTARDITERKQAEVALRESEANYRNLFESANDSIFIIDTSTHYLLNANWNAARRLGYTRQELLQLPAKKIHDPEADTPSEEFILQKLQENGSVVFEDVYQRKDGTKMPVEVSCRIIEYGGQLAFQNFVRDITERKRTEKELQKREELFRRIFQDAPIGMYLADAENHQLIQINPALCQLLDYTESELTALTFVDITYPEDREKDLQFFEQVKKGSLSSAQLEKRYLKKNQEIMWVSLTITVIRDQDNKPLYSLGMVQGISERKHAEERLRLLELAVSNANDAIVITEADQLDEPGPRIVYVNQGFTRLTGYSPEEVIGKTPRLLQGPKTDRAQLERIRTALSRWEPVSVELINYRKDGSEFWVGISIVPFADESGWYTHWMAVERDITERKQAEAILRSSEQGYRLLLHNSTDMMSRYTLEGIYIYVSPASLPLLGYVPDELVGHSVYEFFHSQDLDAIKESHSNLLNSLEASTVTYRIYRKDGSYIWLETTSRVVHDPNNGKAQEIIAVSRDITERKQAEIALEAQVKKLMTQLSQVKELPQTEIAEHRRTEVTLHQSQNNMH